MQLISKCHKARILVTFLLSFSSLMSISFAGLSLRFPFITFEKTAQHPQLADALDEHHHNHHHHHDDHPHNHHHQHDDHHHNNVLNHVHLDQKGTLYLHDPESTVKFFYSENLHGPSNRVDIHDDGCREIPTDYWYNRPKSLWAKHCITLYQSGFCKGEGVQVAGMVTELRSAGMHYGVNSFKPCEKNIRIRFMPAGHHLKHSHHHHSHHHR